MAIADLYARRGSGGAYPPIIDCIDASGDCWIPTVRPDPSHGYCKIGFDGDRHYVHRLVWEALVGPIPEGMAIDHLCRNRACCNPDHLEPVAPSINSLRGETGRHNSRKTHCPSGHPYSGRNLLPSTGGRRRCRACHAADTSRRYYERKARQ